jgi:hypothetical protein
MEHREPRLISEEEARAQGIDEGSKEVKRLAREQPIRIELTEEQLDAIRSQWSGLDNQRPAEITFHVGDLESARFRVAAYGYFSDTCCA